MIAVNGRTINVIDVKEYFEFICRWAGGDSVQTLQELI